MVLLAVTLNQSDKVAIAVIGAAFALLLGLVAVIDDRVRKKTPFDQYYLPEAELGEGVRVIPRVYDLTRFMELVFSYVRESEYLVVRQFVGAIDIETYQERFLWFEDSIYDESLALALSSESKKLFLKYLSEVVGPSRAADASVGSEGSSGRWGPEDPMAAWECFELVDGIQISDGMSWVLLGDEWSGRFYLSKRVPGSALEQASRDGVLVYFQRDGDEAT